MPALALVLIVGTGFALRLGLASGRSLWIDEIHRVVWGKGFAVRHFYDVRPRRVLVNQPPRRTRHVVQAARRWEPFVTVLFLNRWMRITGSDGDFVLKVPLVVFGTLAIVAAALAATEIAGARAGLAAAALLALSPFHVYYAQEVNNYAIALCATAWSYLFYFRLLRYGRVFDGAAYVVATTLALLTHYYTLVVFGAQGLGLLVWRGARRHGFVRTALPFAVVAAAFALYLPVLRSQLGYMFSLPTGAFGGLPYLWTRLVANSVFPWLGDFAQRVPPWPLGLAGALAVWLLFAAGLARVRDARLRAVVAVNTLAPLAVVVGTYLLRHRNHVLWPRYGLFFTIAIFLGVAAFWADGFERRGRAVTAVLLLGAVAGGLHFQFRGRYHRDWAEAADVIRRHGTAEDAVVVHLAILTYPLARYLRTDHRLFGVDFAPTLDLQVTAAVDGAPAAWAVFAWHEGSPGPAIVRRVLECRYPYRDDYTLFEIEMSRYHHGPPRPGVTRPSTCGPPNGFLVGDGGCAGRDGVTVRGWIDLQGAARPHLWAADRDFGPVTRLPAPPPGAPGATSGTNVWFEKRLDLSGVPEGSLVHVTVRAPGPDGADSIAREPLPCVRRPAVVERGVPGPHAMHGMLSAPRPKKRFVRGEPFNVDGWVYSTRGIAALHYHIDGQLVLRSRQHGFALPNVAAAFPDVPTDVATYSGFVARVDTTALAPGRHVLTVTCVHPDGSETALPDARTFDVVEG